MEDSFHSFLHQWEVRPPPDPYFGAVVWGRIAAHEQHLSRRISIRTEELLGRPAWAAVIVVSFLLVGGVAGTAWRHHQIDDERAAGLLAYLLAVNPVARAASDHER